MSLFQSTVVKKYSNTLNKQKLDEKWQLYSTIFHNSTKQQNIRNSKEEQYQAIFLNDLFVQVLGYTQHPNNDYNLITEQKNETNSKKADGAIILNHNVQAVIELKGTETTDLRKIETQAFGYKNNQKDCSYVIISNFEKLHFYIDNATEFIAFNLFQLNREEFNLLWLCLSLESMQTDLPKKIKNESVSNEDKITKELYKDYSAFRRELFSDIERLNPQYNRLELFKKTQKLLDRFLFIFFAEDRQLLPTNLIFSINLEWQKLREARIPISLYDRYKMYFQDLNTGARVTLPAFGKHTNEIVTAQYDIYAYNGGLFQPDEILDNIAINDDLLFKHTRKLSDYDFLSEVDVNILGHIFENSLNEIDEITNAVAGQEVDKAKSKRKKDGVFYTPKYITKYIVDNTIGKLCGEKKNEIGLDLTTIDKTFLLKTNKLSSKGKNYNDKIKAYRDWLLDLKICDPACGSGAFLNEAIEFLINEHNFLEEHVIKIQRLMTGDENQFSSGIRDISDIILEKNIYGVDINEESVEIAKLSLWLRTAQQNRKLNSLNNNIKCGNSLIDDVAVAGEKAFNWEKEFPQVFAKGGFDVVIGNPPYVFGGNSGINEIQKNYFKENYITGNGKVNLFTLFIEKSHDILKIKGEFSFIIPNTFLRVTSYHDSREFFINNFQFRELADLGNNVFNGAVTSAIILIATKDNPHLQSSLKIISDFTGNYKFHPLMEIVKNNYMISSTIEIGSQAILNKILSKSILLGNECEEMIFGIVISHNRDELISDIQLNNYKPFLEGKDISSYLIRKVDKFLNYEPKLIHRARTPKVFEVDEKLLVQRITGGRKPIKVAYDNLKYYNKESINNIIIKKNSKFKTKFILALLNSNLINWFYNKSFTNDSTLTVNISKEYLSKIPIKKISISNQQPFIEKADSMLFLNKELQEVTSKFSKYFLGQFNIEKLSGKLEKWYSLSFEEFIKEINKAIKNQKGTLLTKKEEFDWIDLFEENKKKANEIQDEINKTDKVIDLMVYELYGLTKEQIEIIEKV